MITDSKHDVESDQRTSESLKRAQGLWGETMLLCVSLLSGHLGSMPDLPVGFRQRLFHNNSLWASRRPDR